MMPYKKEGTVKKLGIRYIFTVYEHEPHECQLLTLYIGSGTSPIYTVSSRMKVKSRKMYDSILKSMILGWYKTKKEYE